MSDLDLHRHLGGLDLKARIKRLGLPNRQLNHPPLTSKTNKMTHLRKHRLHRPMPAASDVGPKGGSARPDIRYQYPAFFNSLYALRQEKAEDIPEEVLRYYLHDLTRLDSRTIPGQHGNTSVLREVMAMDKRNEDLGLSKPMWKMTQALGSGSFGQVTLWKRDTGQGVSETSRCGLREHDG